MLELPLDILGVDICRTESDKMSSRPLLTRSDGDILLKQVLGPEKQFREGQWEAIDSLLNANERLLVVQRTGWGKSIVYFLSTYALRRNGKGPTFVVSPLLSLMRNQILAANALGLKAMTINSLNREEWPVIFQAIERNEVDLIIVSPERLANEEFLSRSSEIMARLGCLVIDEAHCISDWGHDFRPDYRRIKRLLNLMPRETRILCTTATANDRVIADIEHQLSGLRVIRGALSRKSLRLGVLHMADQAERLAWLDHNLDALPGSGIIYALTIRDCDRVAAFLKKQGHNVEPYHSQLDRDSAEDEVTPRREKLETDLLENRVKALVATSSLGMGFDKADLGFVIHYQRPGSVVAYYQQVGRAGRAINDAYCILLCGREDDDIIDFFIRMAFPPVEFLQDLVAILTREEGLSLMEIQNHLNLPIGRIQHALKLLQVDGAVTVSSQGSSKIYSRTVNPWNPDVLRREELDLLRRRELEEMKTYTQGAECLMRFLTRALNDPDETLCGKCLHCDPTGFSFARPSAETIRGVHEFLRGSFIEEEPRKWYPSVSAKLVEHHPEIIEISKSGGWKRSIPTNLRSESCLIMSLYGDAGWGQSVKAGKMAGRFDDDLIKAAIELVDQQRGAALMKGWVTCVPSLRRPTLVMELAKTVAEGLQLPFHPVVRKCRETEPQKLMENSVYQFENLISAFAVDTIVPKGPCLLVDDITDSRWTLTLIAALLRVKGVGPVHPFALSSARKGESSTA